jgi:formyl-CoA transferase
MTSAALSGLRVLDLSRVLAGPYCTMLLADFGADVIKVENPDGGDDTRQWGPPWLDDQSAYYLSANRNKRSITVDIKQPEGHEIIRKLILKADVLVENFKVGTMTKYSLGYADIVAENPGLIYCSISGYGQTGPYRNTAGYDFIIQAEGGLMSITGPQTGQPYKVGVAIVDITAGMFASHAILAALHYREKTGQGQYIDVALLDSQIGWLANVGQNYLVSGDPPVRHGNAHPNIVPYEVFQTKDGFLALGVGNDRQYQRLCEVAQSGHLWSDERFQTNPGRVKYRSILIPMLQKVFLERPTSEWIALLNPLGIPVGPINDVPTALQHPQLLERGMLQHIERRGGSPVPLIGPVAKLSETPAKIYNPPPTLGEQTRVILMQELGYSAQEIDELLLKKVI